jgi:hypothetical protein
VTERSVLSATSRRAAHLPVCKPSLLTAKPLDGARQLAAATPLAASRSIATSTVGAGSSAAASTVACAVRLPRGVKYAVAGTACSLLLQTHPPCEGRVNWDVSLVCYSDEQWLDAAQSAQQHPGVPVVFALGACSAGVQSCSFVATQAGTVVCKARTRGRAAAPCTFTFKVVASEPSASASSIRLVHPLPSIDAVAVGCAVPLTLMVRCQWQLQRLRCLTPSTGLRPGCVRQPLHAAAALCHPLQAGVQQQRRQPAFR